jgi:hypothetical protein
MVSAHRAKKAASAVFLMMFVVALLVSASPAFASCPPGLGCTTIYGACLCVAGAPYGYCSECCTNGCIYAAVTCCAGGGGSFHPPFHPIP